MEVGSPPEDIAVIVLEERTHRHETRKVPATLADDLSTCIEEGRIHMPLMFLNGEGMEGGRAHPHIAGSRFVGPRTTAPRYRFFAFGHEFPGLLPDDESGASILGELYDVPMDKLALLLAGEPPQLELSIVALAEGELSFGMVVRAGQETSAGAVGITEFASWRRDLESTNG